MQPDEPDFGLSGHEISLGRAGELRRGRRIGGYAGIRTREAPFEARSLSRGLISAAHPRIRMYPCKWRVAGFFEFWRPKVDLNHRPAA